MNIQERGIQLDGDFEMDEETRFSSVFRGVNNSRYNEIENHLDSRNIETFGDVADSVISKSFAGLISGKNSDGAQVPSSSSSVVCVNYLVSFFTAFAKSSMVCLSWS